MYAQQIPAHSDKKIISVIGTATTSVLSSDQDVTTTANMVFLIGSN